MCYELPANLEITFHLVPPEYQEIFRNKVRELFAQRQKNIGNIPDWVWRRICGEISHIHIYKDEGDRKFRSRFFGHDNAYYVPVVLGKKIIGLKMVIADDKSVLAEWLIVD
jgi:hypothetical protein